MRIVRSSGLRAVVAVKGPGVVTVAIPASLPSHEILELASLVLSTNEYEEFRHVVEPATYRSIRAGPGVGYAIRPGLRGIRPR